MKTVVGMLLVTAVLLIHYVLVPADTTDSRYTLHTPDGACHEPHCTEGSVTVDLIGNICMKMQTRLIEAFRFGVLTICRTAEPVKICFKIFL